MLPDFEFETQLEGCQLYPTFGGAGPGWVTPRGVAFASDGDGLPDFRLALVRGGGPFTRTSARLELRLEATYDLAGAGVPPAQLTPLLPSSGHLRLSLPLSGSGQAETLAVPLTWSTLGRARVTWRLGAEAGAVLRGALEGGTLALGANVVLALRGVAARGGGHVTFDPQALVRTLAGVRDDRGRTTYEALQTFLRAPWDGQPWRWQPSGRGDETPWAALLDRCLARFGRLAPPEDGDLSPAVTFDEPPPGEMTWPLDDVLETWRPVPLEWRPLEAMRGWAERAGTERFVTLISAPPLPRGEVPLEAVGNLPAHRVNVLEVGAHVAVPARPPFRPQPVHVTLTLTPQDTANATLRLSPGEVPAYEVRPYVLLTSVTAGSPRTRVLTGPSRPGSGEVLELGVADLPAHFIPVAAEAALLERAVLMGAVAWTEADGEHHVPIRLERGRAEVSVAVPLGVEPTLCLRAEALSRGASLDLPTSDIERPVTLWHLPGFGAHRVRFVAPTGTSALSVEVETEAGGLPTTLHLRRDRPEAEWSYVVDDPFRPGYRFRPLPDGAWSPYLSPLAVREVTLHQPHEEVPT
ncbi:hypothetical protein V3W47_03625 [Deinococcus sp. YIM 134068]|uniref:hypothetical protein n=1 Tax=Deinococcus lichenicola TaxID=3118910 RepID=UPI002F92BE9D